MTGTPDLSEFKELSKPRVKPCLLADALDELDASEREQLEAALDADHLRITNAAISQWLANRGHDVGWQRVVSHRRGTCTCS